MRKKTLCLICLVLTAVLASSVSAVDRYYTDASGVNHLWSRAGNWIPALFRQSQRALTFRQKIHVP